MKRTFPPVSPEGKCRASRFSSVVLLLRGCALALLCVLLSRAAFAVPAYPHAVELRQPDGSAIQVRLNGDEYFSWHETADGYAVMRDDADGYWKYARPSSGKPAFEIVPGAIVGKTDPAELGLRRGAMPDRQLLKNAVRQRKARTTSGSLTPSLRSSPQPLPGGAPAPSAPPEPSQPSGPVKIPVSGVSSVKNVVILACFNDHWDSTNSRVLPNYGRVNTSEYVNLFNEVGHTNDGAVGSVRDYYNEVSYGKLTVETTVTQWVRLPNNEVFYGANSGGRDIRPREMVADALAAADAAGFDFSQGDSDGDGWVDCLTIIHSGFGEEFTGNPTQCIWSHQWELASVATYDGKKMAMYHTEPALRGLQGSSTSIIRIGVICHEMGHFFGLPDLYDYSNSTWGLGAWCLMAYGAWNGGDGRRPAHFSAWCKCSLGFVVPEIVHSKTTMTLPRVEDNAVVHMVRDGTSNNEYFLVENRANYGFDNDQARVYPGILIHHIDAKSQNNDLGTWAHPLVKIEEADGNDSLGQKVAISQATDVWHSGSGLSGGFTDTTGNQNTNAMMYQTSHAYQRTTNTASYSYVRLTNFSAANNVMTYTLQTLRPTVESLTAGPPTPPNFTVTWGACSDATVYEIQEGTPATAYSFLDSAENEDVAHDNWSFGGTAARSASGAAVGSYSFAMEYGSSVQSVTMRKPFKLLAGTNLSFYVMSHIASGYGSMKCQISNDAGTTWRTLASYSGYIDPWSFVSYNATTITGTGVNIGDWCLLRFVADTEYGWGWSGFPAWGFAFDHVSISGTEMASHANWTSLSSSHPATSYLVSGKPNGNYAYRVRAFSNGVWQAFGLTGDITVVPVTLSHFGLE